MTATRHSALSAPTMPRLFAAAGPGLADSRIRFGELPEVVGPKLISELERAGLSGRGGAGFPTPRKLAAIHGTKPVVIGNGAEGEPLSHKDAVLLSRAPHLVLDGLQAAAEAVGAHKVHLYLHKNAVPTAEKALAERRAAGIDRHPITLTTAPDTFVAGEESAAIHHVEGGPALPRDRTVVSAVSGVNGRPTLVNNVETLAHIGLIARFGADWFRSVGDAVDPGSMLITLSGALANSGVIEVPTGVLLTDVLVRSGATEPRSLRAILIGGYHGSWIPTKALEGLRLSRASLKTVGASPGAGIIHALAPNVCGLARTAQIAEYLAGESARQCGPCRNGLPTLADLLDELAHGRVDDALVKEIRRVAGLVDGRGSCRHPDGTARMIRSALVAFGSDIEAHRRGGCEAA